MKSKFICFAVLLTAASMAPQAQAQVLASDDFSYPDGNLIGNGAWVQYGSATPPMTVEAGQAVILQDGSATQDNRLEFVGDGGAGTFYYSFEFSVDPVLDGSGNVVPFSGTDHEYFATFYDPANDRDNLSARVDLQTPNGTGDFTIGIASDNGTAEATWATDLTYGTTYRVVVSYNQPASQAQFWLDPVSESSLSILGDDLDGPGDTVSSFALRQATNSEVGGTIRVDNVVVGVTFADVVGTTVQKGDVNLDGNVTFLDISPFITILSGNGFQAEADCDCDGDVDFLDISPFIDILSGQ